MADISTDALVPTTAASEVSGTSWGIDGVLSGFIIQSEDFAEDRSTDQTQDQKGRVVYDLDYDRHYTCTLQVIGNGTLPTVGDTEFQWYPTPATSKNASGDKVKWKVQSITYNGSYNDKKKYTINLERWQNYPANA
jgi:hypothetical protein